MAERNNPNLPVHNLLLNDDGSLKKAVRAVKIHTALRKARTCFIGEDTPPESKTLIISSWGTHERCSVSRNPGVKITDVVDLRAAIGRRLSEKKIVKTSAKIKHEFDQISEVAPAKGRSTSIRRATLKYERRVRRKTAGARVRFANKPASHYAYYGGK
ncbi:hypothetical protein HYPSUDRAFT_67634 [Hypholoma sublateritium FD-334 SS-4]|uniref:Uncharacterized protein n=1 Tax=Hypholoma sublateritium (strain FD-334 SS-4) TaxID=945553 RepID=A0A0D2L4J4_HYPSF|nr:hypothetical protein HYPSUDRAFT_67634 [Hypholoma sublateritium FD-334 SS-4]